MLLIFHIKFIFFKGNKYLVFFFLTFPNEYGLDYVLMKCGRFRRIYMIYERCIGKEGIDVDY